MFSAGWPGIGTPPKLNCEGHVLWEDHKALRVARPVQTKVPIEREHLLDAKPFRHNHQRCIRKVHRQVRVTLHPPAEGCHVMETYFHRNQPAGGYPFPNRISLIISVEEMKSFGEGRPSCDQARGQATERFPASRVAGVSRVE